MIKRLKNSNLSRKCIIYGLLLLCSGISLHAFAKGQLVTIQFGKEQFGKEPLAKEQQRIVALSPHSVEILFALGVGDRIVGTLEYADYPLAAKKIPRIGNFAGIQIEKLVALKPDLVVAWKSGNKASDLEKIQSLGFNIFYSHPNNITDVIEEIKQLAMLTARQTQGLQITDKMQQEYLSIKKQTAAKKPVRVFYQLWHQPLRSIGGNNWLNSMIKDCAGDNVFENSKAPYPVVSFESVLARNPQVIIIPSQSASRNLSIFGERKKRWLKWPQILAVENKHIVQVNGDLLHRFTPRAIDGLRQLCQVIDQARD